jgi:hypothetical protein
VRRREEVYRAYWGFAAERQRIFERRIAGKPSPWTEDEILSDYRFTNPWRASDRVSQFLIRDVIYAQPELPAEDQLIRIVFFRLFSRNETWRSLEAHLGTITARMVRWKRLERYLEELQEQGPIYTSAFILCANKAYGYDRKYLNHLGLLREMARKNGLAAAVARCKGLKDLYEALATYPLLGPFMSYQLAIDINYSELVDFSENEFTVPGPGAERGIQKVFPEARRDQMPAIIRQMVEEQSEACTSLGLSPPTLFGRSLHAIDCQNLFCEVDKYARVRFPHLRSNRIRIKATFSPSDQPLALFYPPKWGINELAQQAVGLA